MKERRSAPSLSTRRPPEPIRPLPARRTGTSLLGAKVRRRRYRDILPPAGESGTW